MADQLATCRANLLGELSAVSHDEPEGSKCSCWPGNLRRSISHSSCSWSSPRRWDRFPSRRLLGDLDGRSLFLEDLANSEGWSEELEGLDMSLSRSERGLDDELVPEFSVLHDSVKNIRLKLKSDDMKEHLWKMSALKLSIIELNDHKCAIIL